MIAVGLGVAVVTAVVVGVGLRVRALSGFVLAVYVLTLGQVVGVVEVLSAFRGVTERNVLVAEGLLLVVAVVWVVAAGVRLELRVPVGVRGMLVGEPLVAGLLVLVVAGLGYELALAVFTPPNNWDSMTYHLSRAAAWYQHRGVAYVVAPNQRENAYPANAEILILWSFLFAHGDRFAAVWQWLAGLVSLVSIFVIARRLGASRAAGLFAALVFACLSQVVLQSVTTQNDLVTASLVVAVVAFLAGGERYRLLLAALAFGLAVGTKGTTLFALPALLVIAAVLVPRREWARLVGLSLVASAAFGSLIYVLNYLEEGSLLGAPSATAGQQQTSVLGFIETVGHVAGDLAGDPRGLGLALLPPNEDWSYFGLLGGVLVVPVVVFTLYRWRRGRAIAFEGTLALALPLYLVTLACVYSFNPWIGRFLITPIALVAPLFARVPRHRLYAGLVTALAAATLVPNLLFDHAKPSGVLGGQSIWAMTRAQGQAVQQSQIEPLLAAVETDIPPAATIGYVLYQDDWDYPLYGAHFTHRLVQLDPSTAYFDPTNPYTAAIREHLDWIVIRKGMVKRKPPPVWHRVVSAIGLRLFERTSA